MRLGVELGLQVRLAPTPPGCRVPVRTSPVCAMKPSMTRWNDDAVIEAFARQLLDARDVVGRQVGAQLDDDACPWWFR